MTKSGSLLLFWVTLLAVFISLTSVTVKTALPGQVFQILFIPVTIYLVYTLVNNWTSHTPALNFQSGWMRLLIYYCFIVTATLVVASFLSANTLPQVTASLIFSPLVIYFFLLIFPRRNQIPPLVQIFEQSVKATVRPKTNLDEDRRDFLKLIGTAGVSIFLYNLFLRRDPTSLFGTTTPSSSPLALKNTQGEVINPAEKSPTQGYYISQIDDSTISYFGFINNLGQWFIMRQDTDNAYRYCRGDKDFTSNWTDRAKLTYDYFDNVF